MPDRRRTTAEPPAYRGPDRRRHVETLHGLRAARPALALLLLAVVWALAVAFVGDDALGISASPTLRARLEIAGGALAIFASGICVLRWHLEGTSPSLWLGCGLFVLGLPGVALVDGRADESAAVALAALWVSAVLFACAMRGPEIDSTLSPVVVAGATAAGLIVAFVAASTIVVVGPVAAAGVGTGLLYLVLAARALARSRQPGFADGAWLVTVLAAVGAATILWTLAPSVAGIQALGAALLRCTAFGLAAAGSVGVLSVSAGQHRSQAFRSRIEHAEEAEIHRQLEADYAERLHEVRSSVLALHGGVRTLDTVEGDAGLAVALEAELVRLQELVAPGDTTAPGFPFAADEALVPMLCVCKAAGWPVLWEIPPGLLAIGRPARCVQIVHGLVANAHRHAGGTPIDVCASAADGHVVVRVEDRGPGVARGLREQIFDPGFREDQAIEGHGLGLAIGRRLAREQGGDLWFESRPGGGATFVLSLTAFGHAGPGVNVESRGTGLRLT